MKKLFQRYFFNKGKKEHTEYTLALSDFHKSLTLINDHEQIKIYIIAKIQEIIKVDKIFLFLYNEDYHRFVLSNAAGVEKSLYTKYYFTQKDKLIYWLSVNEKHIILNQNPDILSFFTPHEQNIVKDLDISYIHPLKVMNRLIGLIFLGKKSNGKEFNKNDVELLSILLDQAAFAFENTNLHQQQRDRIKKMYRTDRLAIMGQLAAGAAHEIRNPLTSIRSTIQYVQKDVKDPVKAKMTKELLKEVDRINEIIQGLLSFSNPDILKKEQINLNQLIDQSVLLISNILKKKNCQLSISYNAEQESLYADASQLKQVFLNIIMNAIQSLDKDGKVEVIVDSNKKEDSRYKNPSEEYIISIKDNGSGISQENLEKIFDPFFTTKDEGTGLGLSISYGIIIQHHGDISIESKLNKGTNVIIKLPINSIKE